MLKIKIPRRLKLLLKPFALAGLLLAVFVAVLKFPDMRQAWVRNMVAERIFEIKGIKEGGGGTGFQVEAANGKAFIMTNSHVCEMAQKDGKDVNFLLVKKNDHWMKRRILEVDDKSDLCLVEGWPNLSGLVIGDMPKIGDRVSAVGHPHLGPITQTTGEVTAFTDTQIPHHILPSGNARKDKMFGASKEGCTQPKNEIKKRSFWLFGFIPLGEMSVCYVNEKDSIQTNVTIFPGNSGSPLLDASGKVVGVVFASDGDTTWGFAVNVNHLKLLLKDF